MTAAQCQIITCFANKWIKEVTILPSVAWKIVEDIDCIIQVLRILLTSHSRRGVRIAIIIEC